MGRVRILRDQHPSAARAAHRDDRLYRLGGGWSPCLVVRAERGHWDAFPAAYPLMNAEASRASASSSADTSKRENPFTLTERP